MKFKNFIADTIGYAKQASDDITSRLDEIDGEFYAEAEEEIKNGSIDRGLWSKALVKARGDENLRKAIYIELRVKQLKVEEAKSRRLDNEIKKLLPPSLLAEAHKNTKDKEIPEIDKYDEDGYTQLMRAVKRMDVEAVIDLLDKGANPAVIDEAFGNSTAQEMATRLLKEVKTAARQRGYQAIIYAVELGFTKTSSKHVPNKLTTAEKSKIRLLWKGVNFR